MRLLPRVPALAGLLTLFLSPPATAQELPFTHFTTDHQEMPLPLSNLQRIHQDRLGYLWIGFYGSVLARYDGHTIQQFTPQDGVPEFTVREIVEAQDGRLWIGSDSGVAVSDRPLQAYAPGDRVRFVSSIGGVDLPQTRIRQNGMVCDRHGRIWVGTQGDGIYRYSFDRNGRLQAERFSTAEARGGRNTPVVAVGARSDGSVWVSLNTGNAIVFPHAAPARWVRPPCTTSSFHDGRSGALWGGCMTGQLWRHDREFAIVSNGSKAQITAIQETKSGELWVATHGAGAIRIRGSREETYGTREGMPGNIVWDILEDREGNLWLAQEGGLSRLRFDHPAFVSYDRRLPAQSALSVLPRRDEHDILWIGTTAGLAAIDAAGAVASFDVADGLYSSAIYSLARDDRGRIWIGTGRGVNAIVLDASLAPPGAPIQPIKLFSRNAFLVTILNDNNPVYSIRRIALPAETLWFASPGSLRCFDGTKWFYFTAESGLSPTGATSVDADAAGHLWVGTSDRGVLRTTRPVTLESLEALETQPMPPNGGVVMTPFFAPVWNRRSGAPTNAIRNIATIDGEMWIGTARGVAVFRSNPPALVARLGAHNGLGGDLIAGLERSPRTGTLWVSQNRGLAEVDPRTRRVLRVLSKHDGLIDGEAWGYGSVAAGGDGSLFLATAKGVTHYRPALDVPNRLALLLRVRAANVQQNNRGGNRVTIRFAALSFAGQQQIVYRTRLIGEDDAWSPPTHAAEVRYANLPAFLFPKTYRFEVTAANRDGVSSAPAAWAFSILPAWWFRWWACLGYLAVLAALLDLVHRYRVIRLRTRNRELQDLVDDRTAAIRAQTAELETLDQIVRAISRETALEGVLQSLLDEGKRMFAQAEKGVFVVFDHASGRCEVAAVSGFDRERFRGVDFSLEETLHRCSESDQLDQGLYLVRDFDNVAGSEQFGDLPRAKSMLAMEVTMSGRVAGLLIFHNFRDSEAFRKSDLQKLKRFREHANLAVAKAVMLRELETRNREVQEATEAKSMFLASMSHELRTPLNAIIGFSQILLEKHEGSADPRQVGFLRNIHEAGEHLMNIINDVLDLSKVEAGKMQFFPEPFSVREAAESICHVMKGVAMVQRVAFEIDIPADLPLLESDPAKFKQVLYNLLSNAVKFSPPQSTVTISARVVRTASCDAAIALSVIDRGVGIDEEHLGSVFEEFRQLGGDATKVQKGTGLGLALVRKFVELQGGEVSVRSRRGRGSTFTVTMPLHYQGVASEPRAEEWPAGDRVLMVEDDAMDYCVARDALQAAGFVPIRARSADDALQLARSARPVAITLDVVLPGTDGWEVLKILKSDPATHDIPVVIVSRADNRDLGLALGADEYFVKPVDGDALVRRLQKLRLRVI